ncbi:hypothetical protein [Desulfosediminicola ganghwensis]|uniref:hypothetical protein n=1 Tax=Desulfosediminicola ganghwensis TaxID=2569540 RepID=UPI0010AC23FB|nr:hypothetical protein [Desulfosediminicola ganghwensis]
MICKILVLLLLCLPFIANADNKVEEMSLEKQYRAIQDTVDEITKVLPVKLNDTITWQSMYFVKDHPVLGGIYFVYSTNIPYEDIDKDLTPSVMRKFKNRNTHTTCANDTYKQFLFIANVPVRIVYQHSTGQLIGHLIIDKSDCLKAGYQYP